METFSRSNFKLTWFGFQVAPAELEGLLINHPGIDDIGIFGVSDKEAGELPKALVVKKPGVKVTKEEIHAFVDGKFTHSVRNFKTVAKIHGKTNDCIWV